MAAVIVFLAGFAVYKIVEAKKERKEEKRRAAAGEVPPAYHSVSYSAEDAARTQSKRKNWRNKLSRRRSDSPKVPKDIKLPGSETASIAPPAYS